MEKKQFIEQLRRELIKRGFDKKTVDAEMIPVDRYFEESGMTDIAIAVNDMADEISDMLSEKQKEEAAEAGNNTETEKAAGPGKNAGAKSAGGIEDALLASGAELSVVSDKNAPDTEKQDETAGITDDTVYSADSEVENIEDFAPADPSANGGKPGLVEKLLLKLKGLLKKKPAEGEEFAADAEEYGEGKNKVLFWIIFCIALPIVLALALIVIALYLAFWVFLALLMIFIIAGLIAFVFAGALISLIGIIYGIIVVIKGMTPVGLYEIGLGITVGAVVMFVGILVYNIAIRLIPFGMKMLAKLFMLAFRRGKEAFQAFRRIMKTL